MQHFVTIVKMLSRISGVVSTLLILLSIIVVCQMIFQRQVLGQSTIWQTEFVIFSLIAATFVGAPYVLLTRGHVNVDLLPLVLGHRGRMVLRSEERRVGKEGVRKCRSRWSPYH